MNQQQFELIVRERFARVDAATIQACKDVIMGGVSAYSAEDTHKCKRGTVSRYATKVHAELSFCEEVANHAKS